jgi:uncharacterized membrane protein
VVGSGDRDHLSLGGLRRGGRPLVAVAVGLVTAVTLLVAFTLLALGVEFFWVAFPVGFGGLLPAAIDLAKWYGDEADRDESQRETARAEGTDGRADALSLLREYYARGDIDEEEFERRIEYLLEMDSIEAAAAYTQRRREQESVAEKEL